MANTYGNVTVKEQVTEIPIITFMFISSMIPHDILHLHYKH